MPSLRLLVDNALQNACTCPHAHQQCVRVACAFVKLMYNEDSGFELCKCKKMLSRDLTCTQLTFRVDN